MRSVRELLRFRCGAIACAPVEDVSCVDLLRALKSGRGGTSGASVGQRVDVFKINTHFSFAPYL